MTEWFSVGTGDVLELLINQPIFIGLKADNSLRQRLEALSDSDRQYVSAEDPAFLRICRVGDDTYVGKLISDNLNASIHLRALLTDLFLIDEILKLRA